MWRGMDSFKKWLDNLPSTNFKIFISAVLSCGTALVLFTAFLLRIKLDEPVLAMWLGYLGAFAGINYLHFAKKRETYIPSPPNNPDVEDADAGRHPVRSNGAERPAPVTAAPPQSLVAPSSETPPRGAIPSDERPHA